MVSAYNIGYLGLSRSQLRLKWNSGSSSPSSSSCGSSIRPAVLCENLPALANRTLLPVPIEAPGRPKTLVFRALGGTDPNPPALSFREKGVICGVSPDTAPAIGLLPFPPAVKGAGVVVMYPVSRPKGVPGAGVGMSLKRPGLLLRDGVCM